MATGLCNHHRGTILPGFPPQAFPRLSSADHWVDNADRSPKKGNLEPSWNSELIACRNQRAGRESWRTTLYQRQPPSEPGPLGPAPTMSPKVLCGLNDDPFAGRAADGSPQDNIGTSEDFFPCRNGSNRASLIPQSLDAVLLSQDADLKGHIIALDIRR